MDKSTELIVRAAKHLQEHRRKIEPIIDAIERSGPLLDKLEQIKQVDSKIGQLRIALDAIDNFLKKQYDVNRLINRLESMKLKANQIAPIADLLNDEELSLLIEQLREKLNARSART